MRLPTKFSGEKSGRGGRRGRPSSQPVPKSSLLVKKAVASVTKPTVEKAQSAGESPPEKRIGDGVTPTSGQLTRRDSGGTGVRALSSLPCSPARHPPGILKKSSLDETNHPVSILKRKTSRDDGVGVRGSSPVKWCPDVEAPSSRGILKKHRSLDEQHVSDHSLSNQNGERTSLKGRRCSLEEPRCQSPDGPASILKRKTSREECRPSILKGRCSSPGPDARPILKKKSSEESDDPHDPPRPILKKRAEEEHQVRPILKTKSDGPQEIRPILKNNDEVVMRNGRGSAGPGSQYRRSLDPNFVFRPHDSPPRSRPLSVAERILTLENGHDSSPPSLRMEGDEEGGTCSLSRSGSVSERASMWKKLEQENRAAAEARRVPKGTRGRAARGDPASRFSTQPVTLGEVQQARRNNFTTPLDLAGLLKNIKDKTESGGAVALDQSWEETPSHAPGDRLLSSDRPTDRLLSNDRPSDRLVSSDRFFSSDRRVSSDGPSDRLISSERPSDRFISNERPSDRFISSDRPSTRLLSSDRPSDRLLSSESDSSDSEPSEPHTPLSSSPQRMVGGVVVRARPDEADGAPVGSSIAERLAALQRSGSTDWRKRLQPLDNGDGGGGVAERLGQLETARQGWRARVGEKDNHRFTVAGRMASIGLSPVQLPIIPRSPAPQQVFTTRVEPGSTPATPETDTSSLNFIKRSASAPSNQHLKNLYNGGSKVERTGPKISVPDVCDEEFHSFFPGYDPSQSSQETINLDNLDIQPSSLLVGARRVRMQRRHHSANPLKALARRSDLTTEYVEVRSGIAEKELTRIKLDKLMAGNRGLAVEAVAGLASREELGKVVLRPAAESPAPRQVAQWHHPLLVRVKGRRHPVLAVIEPTWTSVNQGDAFLLVSQSQVFCWCGEYCNVIEKSRASEAATDIQTRRDLGCLSATRVTHLEGTCHSAQHRHFWNLLGLPADKLSSYTGEESGHPEEDELYESAVSGAYRSYTLEEGKLVPLDQGWARVPKVECLDTTKVMVFDFVTEVYCWCGKQAGPSERRTGGRLAEALAAESPPWHPSGLDWLDRQATNPRTCFTITHHMEPVLFREKFADWPDFKRRPFDNENGVGQKAVRACDVKPMVSWQLPCPDLVLENSHLGRGTNFYDDETRRFFQVETVGVEVWRVEDHCPSRVPEEESTYFSDDRSYIIKWNYSLTVTGRELSGVPSKHQAVGRERLAYLTWQGRHSGLETGTAALLAADMDPGAAPHLIVRQGCEPPALLALLSHPLVVSSSSTPRLYLVEPGQDPSEQAVLRQVPAEPASLRPGASFWYVGEDGGESYLWHGAGSKAAFRSAARDAVCSVASSPPPYLAPAPLEVTDTYQGSEPTDFLRGALEGTEVGEKASCATKMFELALVKGVFTATGVPPLRYNPDPSSAWTYVYSQEELYGSRSLTVLIESHCGADTTVWLWTRVSPTPPEALTTLLSYSAAVQAGSKVVAAHAEPPSFTALFPWWSPDPNGQSPEGWSSEEVRCGEEEVAKLAIRVHPVEELRTHPLPAGVDPARLELYLHPDSFLEVLSVSKSDFDSLPAWKQLKLKKSAGLF